MKRDEEKARASGCEHIPPQGNRAVEARARDAAEAGRDRIAQWHLKAIGELREKLARTREDGK